MAIPHDARVALANKLMREAIDPVCRPIGEGALLMLFQTGQAPALMTYISNCERSTMRDVLRTLLAKWDADARAKGETN